jgi:hypothetical protein
MFIRKFMILKVYYVNVFLIETKAKLLKYHLFIIVLNRKLWILVCVRVIECNKIC